MYLLFVDSFQLFFVLFRYVCGYRPTVVSPSFNCTVTCRMAVFYKATNLEQTPASKVAIAILLNCHPDFKRTTRRVNCSPMSTGLKTLYSISRTTLNDLYVTLFYFLLIKPSSLFIL